MTNSGDSEYDKFWNLLVPHLRNKQGFAPLTPEEADAAYDAAPEVPMTKEDIEKIVRNVTERKDGC